MTEAAASVIAVNTAVGSENPMHDDDVARTYGFAGGLVPGVTVFAYVASLLAEREGSAWLDGGAAAIRLDAPAYDGDRLDLVPVDGAIEVHRGVDVLARCETSLEAEPERDVGTAERAGPRYEPTLEALTGAPPLSPVVDHPGRVGARAYATRVGAHTEPFASGERMHPGWLLGEANRVLAANVELGPWIHVQSAMRFLGPAPAEAEWVTRARIRSAWERKGHLFCDLDCVLTADGSPAAAVTHRSIVRPALRDS